jgi:hypothetical protein
MVYPDLQVWSSGKVKWHMMYPWSGFVTAAYPSVRNEVLVYMAEILTQMDMQSPTLLAVTSELFYWTPRGVSTAVFRLENLYVL